MRSSLKCTSVPDLQRTSSFQANDPYAAPSFLIIGTAKGGTSDLHSQLVSASIGVDPDRPEPPVLTPVFKEADYLRRPDVTLTGMLPGGTLMHHYLELLSHPCATSNHSLSVPFKECVRSWVSRGQGPLPLTIDSTPHYDMSATAPFILRSFSPLSKIVIMLRDPVDRTESLYNHWKLTSHDWQSTTLDQLATSFLEYAVQTPGVASTLERLAATSDVAAMADGWRELLSWGITDVKHRMLFAGGLYPYTLAAWRLHYFQPGRVMLIDSHAYFKDRPAVMEKVIAFLYGRPMTPAERRLAAEAEVKNAKRLKIRSAVSSGNGGVASGHTEPWYAVQNGPTGADSGAAGGAGSSIGAAGSSSSATSNSSAVPASDASTLAPGALLSHSVRRALQNFYQVHMYQHMPTLLSEMKLQGACLVGFEGAPWLHDHAAG